MTGHGRGEARTQSWTSVVECHSVNRKTAEVVVHADRSAALLEPSIRERVLERISRGRVQVNLSLAFIGDAAQSFFDEKRAAEFVEQARRLQKKLGLDGGVSLADVLAAPGVVRASEVQIDSASATVMAALDEALEGLVATRAREGMALKKALSKSANHLGSIIKKTAPLAGKVTAAYRGTLRKRLEQAGIGHLIDDPRLATEVAIFAERCDITEELERAASHIEQFHEKLDAKGPVGRTLEFLTQELGREFNTLGSKSAHTTISRLVIEAKSELDRIREQLANIE
ncbi:MAG: YicC/YloC family endoribonuclease [bacterium]